MSSLIITGNTIKQGNNSISFPKSSKISILNNGIFTDTNDWIITTNENSSGLIITNNSIKDNKGLILFPNQNAGQSNSGLIIRGSIIGLLPSPPTITGTPIPSNGTATVSFTAPLNNGGSPVVLYTVISSPGNITGSGSSSPITVSGLTNGTSYTFTMIAINSTGNSIPSSPSSAVIPFTVANAPTGVSATPGNGTATVSFTAPLFNGGSVISLYTAVSTPDGVTGTSNGSSITVNGLTNGTSYTFSVYATNSAGNGSFSTASSAVTPVAPVTLSDPYLVITGIANANPTSRVILFDNNPEYNVNQYAGYASLVSDQSNESVSGPVTANPGSQFMYGGKDNIQLTGLNSTILSGNGYNFWLTLTVDGTTITSAPYLIPQ